MERLATLLSDAPLDQIRTKWSELSSKSTLRLAPPSSKLRTTPCAADHLPEGGPLRCEDFLILLHHFRPGENEEKWSQDALDLFKQLDVTGDGLVEWSEFADFILAQDMSRPPGGMYELAVDENKAAELVGCYFPRTYSIIEGGCCSWDVQIRKLVYLPPPIHRVAAFPTKQRDNVMIVSANHPPRKQSGMLKHHTSYREHEVWDCVGVDGTEICVTSSSLEAPVRTRRDQDDVGDKHYLTMWRITKGMPDVVHRRETPKPQQALCYAPRLDRLFTGGIEEGFVYEYAFDDPPRIDSDIPEWKKPPPGPVALVKCRCLRCHVFGISVIQDLHRRLEETNLIATGSTDGTLHVWLQGDWYAGQTADYDTVASVESAMTDISHSHASSVIPKPQDRTELEPLARLSAQTAGSAVLAHSDRHELLFSCGRKPVHGDYSSGDILVWDVSNVEVGMRLQALTPMTAHEARVSDLLELPDEDRLLSADINGVVIAWSLPGLVPLQTFQGGNCVERVPLYRDAPPLEAGKPDGCVIYGAGPLKAFRRTQPAVKEALVRAHYDANMGTFLCGSAHRICVWDGSSGKMRSQVGIPHLLAQDTATLGSPPKLRSRRPVIKGRGKKFEVDLYKEVEEICGPEPTGEAVAYSIALDGRKLAVCTAKGGVHVCVVPSGGHAPRLSKNLDPHASSCSDVCLVDEDKLVLSGGLDGKVAVADDALATGYEEPTEGVQGKFVRLRDVNVVRARKKKRKQRIKTKLKAMNALQSPTSSVASDDLSATSPQSQSSEMSSIGSPTNARSSFESMSACSFSFASSPQSPTGTESKAFASKDVRHEVLCCVADAGLSLVASVSRSSNDPHEPFICVWDFEHLELRGTCSPPVADLQRAAQQGTPPPRVTSVVFVRPYPVLCGSTSTGTLHLWRVPECTLLASLTFVDTPSSMPFVEKPEYPAFLTDVSKPEVKDVSFGCVDVAVHDAGCTLSAGADDGTCVVWSLSADFFTHASLEKNALQKRDNYNPRRQAHPVVEWGELRRSRRLSRISFGANPSPAALDDAQTASDEARCWDAHAGVVSSVQVVARPQAIVTAGEDGMARVWTWEGEPIGLLDVNDPEGNGIPWHFRTAAFEEHGSNGEAREMLLQAKAAAAFYAGMKSRATRDEKARARQIALTKLKQGTPEGLEDLASHTIRSRISPPRSPITSHRKSTLVIEDVSPDEGWALMVKSPTAFQLRDGAAVNPHDTASEGRKGWDAVFNGINALEEQNRANELALNSPSKLRRRRSIRGAIKTGGKTWRTLPSLIDLSHLASELPGPPGRCDPPVVRKPRPHGRVKSLRERVLARRDQLIPRTLGPDPVEGFADNGQSVARMMRLAHMGY